MDGLAGRAFSAPLPVTVSAVGAEETLAEAPEPLELPADRSRPAQPEHSGAFVRLELDEELVAAMKALVTRHNSHISTVLLAGWAAVLGRLSGQTDLVVGTSMGSREAEGLTGGFASALPVRVDVWGLPTTAELLGRVEARVQGALRNQDLPSERVVELEQPDGAAASASPLFRAAFAWRDAPGSGLQADAAVEPRSTAGLDLSLELWEENGGVAGQVVFATALFDRETVERYTGYLCRMLAGMAADETLPVDRLALLSDEERRLVVEEWNRTETPYPADSYIHERFEAQAGRTPDAVAVVFEDRELTYGDLNARANRLAHHLRSLGVGPDVRVGICVEREPELVVAVLGVLKSGGAYLPLDPAYPRERLLDMVRDSAPVVMLTQGSLAARLGGLDVPLLSLDADAAWWAGQPATDPERAALSPEHLTYVIYTSGSTGRPKGVMMTHGGASNLLHWYLGATGITERDAVLVVTSFSFHLTQRNLLAPLFVGGRVHLAREPFEPHRITAQIVASGVTMMNLTPTGFQALVEADGGRAIGGLRIVVFGGEPLYPRQLARVPEPRPVFLNPYGSTEATGITAHHFARAELSSYSSRSMPPGRPIANATIYVLDAAGEPVPVGVTGELYLGGAGVTRGYRGLPGHTAERYLPDPFGATPGARLYRTGDLGRWLADGTIEFMGRADAQVKVRGFRIELGEIEARLAEHAAVHETVVVARARDGEMGDPRLVAYYTGEPAGAASLRAHLAERLPEYMVPAAFVHMDALPVNPNGKLDRKALPEPEFAPDEKTYVAPRTPVEEVLAGIWAEVLGVERAGVHDEFFGLGGHSLLATRVVSRVREVFGVELPLRALFEGPTVAELAGRVEEMRRAGVPVLPPVVPAERTGALPLSFAQERLWFLDQLRPGEISYNLPFALRLRGALDADALERSLGEIVRRHEALRTVFREQGGTPRQVVAPFGGFRLTRKDLSHLLADGREAEVQRELVAEGTARPFDLAAGPLFRASLLHLGAEEHVLLLSQHHIVSDGWSMGVLYRELSALYQAYREGRESPLPELPIQYADYALWQREHRRDGVLEGQLAYWRERLADAAALLELPTDHPRPAVQTFRGATVTAELSLELLERLQALGRSEGATLYMVLLSAFQVLLGKYSGSEDIVVGSPVAGRTRKEVEALIGFFVNTLVLRTDLSGDPSFREVLRRAREVALGAYEHQEVPFERLVAELQPERSLSHSPLFQVMFALQNAGGQGGALPGLKTSEVGAELASAKVDLSLVLKATAHGLSVELNYSTDLFERSTADRMLSHLERVLEQVTANADVWLSRLELLGEAERALVLEAWNRTAAEYAAASCIHELFEQQVERAPDALALACGSVRLSYAELNARANRLAHHLRSRGVGPDARVAISLERGPGMVVALLAVLKAGGAYVPLDPDYPEQRLRWMLEDSAPALLLTRDPLVARFADAGVPLLDLAEEAAWAGAPATDPERGALRPEHLAYLVYTSGSTGRPKGAMIQHRNVCGMVAGQIRSLPLEPESRILQFASFSFDGHVFEVFLALARGASLHLSGQPGVLAGDDLVRTVAEAGITHAILPPAVLAALPDDERLPSIHTLIVSGDAPPADLMARWSSGRRLINGYGPTEATVCTTLHDYVPGASSAPPPIGRPVANVRVYLLDAAGAPVPRGTTGELYIGGVTVGRGYWRRAALTAGRFVPDPFGAEPGARLYRTGDLARWNAEGALHFAGRVDAQVKVRGFRIELGEIEGALRRCEGVADCVVVAREDVPGEKRLVAYVVGGVEADELREHLRQNLPGYMVPAAFVPLDRLPLTANGKLDRKALPVPEYGPVGERYVAPRTPVEEVLAGIWAEVLRLERVGVEESFFELGGHSLLATRVVSRVRELFGVELPLRALFEGPTVAELAGRVEAAGLAWSSAQPRAVERVDRGGRLPLSFAQQRLWFLEQMGDLGSAYHVAERLRLRGALDRAALRRALDGLVARHEVLRTTIHEQGGEPEQRIGPETTRFHLVEHDLAEQPEELERVMAAEAAAPFDLEQGPLIRGRLIRLAADDHVLVLAMHHIVSDGWSMGVLFDELSALYAAHREGREAHLPELPVQYADYAAWQRQWLEGDVLREQADYWARTLAGAPELLELPTDRPRPAQVDPAGARFPVELDEELTAGLKALSRRHGTTLFMTLVAGWAVVLSRLSGQDDVVIGTPTAGRGRRETEGLIGCFVNTLALRLELLEAPTVAELLGRVKERALAAQHRQDIPFEQVVERVDPARSLSHHPLFQVVFAWLDLGRGDGNGLELPGLEVGRMRVASSYVDAKVDLWLGLSEANGRILGSVMYATALFEQETVERYLAYLRRVLEAFVADDLQAVDALPLLPEAERRRVVEEWNRTEAPYPAEACIHELFERQAARTPEAAAAVFEGELLTYAELNARANRLAHHLRALGVGPDARVAICVERGLEMVVGMLGVLKAGGGYVPLDPAYPAERLRYMLEDSGPGVVLTQTSVAAAQEGLFDGLGAQVLPLDAPAWRGEPATDPERGALGPEHLAYMIYTSGSTGQPKGVMVAHRGVCNLVSTHFPGFALEPGSRVLQFSAFSFDACVFEVFRTLTRGASLYLAPRARLLTSEALGQTVHLHGITHAVLPPAMLESMPEGETLDSLRTLVLAGDVVRESLVRRWAPGRVLVDAYGPSETAVCASLHACRAGEPGDPPIGQPIANTRIYLLDRGGEPVPVGAVGELYIGGACVARGYHGRPELTAERFVADPFAGEPGARLYRTGDLGRWRPDGTIGFAGRSDFQVKLRGFRVELGEVERRLLEHAAVREAVVVARAEGGGDQRLVAYWVGGEGGDTEGLRAHLGERLPEHMVPAAYVRLQALPLTPSGKLDRKALPAPEGEAFARRGYEAPVGEVEQALAEVWSEVLGVERVGRWDDFFELGGHSLLTVQMATHIQQVLDVEVEPGKVFECPVLKDLAELLAAAGRAELPPIERVDRGGRLPLSFAQQRLWFLEQMGGVGSAYHVPMRRRLRGVLDRAALRRALDGLVARHEVLRTAFHEQGGEPEQRIAPETTRLHLVEHDLSGQPGALERMMDGEVVAPFDLEQGPLIRGRLIRLAADDHVLLLTMHHIVADGWSMGVLFRELSALYEAYRGGRESPLSELAVQYADYAVWQREQLEGEVLDRQLAYWRERLAGAPELLELPTDHPRPAVQTHRGAKVPVELSLALQERLQALGRSEGATLYMTLLGAFQVLLSKYGGGEDIVVGSPIAGRTRREVEELIGFFVNTLVLRTDLSGNPSFREVLRRVRQETLGAYKNQEVPFEKLVAELQPERSLRHSPLFQVMFTFGNAEDREGDLPGLTVSGIGAEPATAKFDLSLVLTATAQGLRGGLTFSTDLFERGTVERMLGHLVRVLEQVAADPDASLSRLALAGPEERARVVVEWNRTERPFPREACIHQLFQAQAGRTPDAVALAWGPEELTYRELDARANRLAHYMAGLGVGPESRVGVRLERSLENVVATLAVLKAGGCCVPIDTSYPAERMELMLADSGARVLLSRSELVPAQTGRSLRVVCLDHAADEVAGRPADQPRDGAAAGNLAYVFYTSGSTGRPKGVMMTHREVVQYASCLPETIPIGPGDRMAQASNASFDAAVFEIWGALLNGASLVGIDRDVLLSAPLLGQALRGQGITHLYQTAALLNQHVQEQVDIYASLRQLVFGAEAVGTESVRRMLRSGRPGRVLHEYGPTEATVWCTLEEVEEVEEEAPTVPIGGPIPNARAYVLDAAGEPVPAGVLGELCIGGAGVVRGYLGRPGLTAERFVPDPFAAEPGGRMYRTGDRARWKAQGKLEFMGRLDDQVKIRGFRIEPGEVEAAIVAYPGVREARVMMREDQPGDKRLVAYVVGSAEMDGLRAHLRQGLPEYMVPAAYVYLEALPLTPNGKVDRTALPAPEGDAYARRGHEAPVGETEQVLAEIWSEVLGLERVGRWDNFFELGGHSLLVVRVNSRIRQALGVEVEMGLVFQHPLLNELAGALATAGRADLPAIERVDRAAPLPLSFAQQRLWFLEQLGDLGSTYHIPHHLRLRGALDREALARALDRLVARHEALRTTFRLENGEPEQRIAPETAGFALVEHDLAGAAEGELARVMAGEASARFDLERGPLFRGRLVRLADDDHVLLLTMHHIVSDAWSMGVLTHELGVLYAAFHAGLPDPLPALPIQYADYAAWQQRWVKDPVVEAQAGYWTKTLAGAPQVLELPADHPRPQQQDHAGASLRLELDAELTAGLKGLSRRHGTTLFMTLLAGWATVLGRLSGQDDVVVGTPTANRGRREIEGLIGFFANTLALRVDFSARPTAAEVLGRVKARALEAQANQDIPFEQVVERMAPVRNMGHHPLFQVVFTWQDAERGGMEMPGLRLEGVPGMVQTTAKFDLSLALSEVDGRIAGGLNYATSLFERATVERQVGYLRRVLEQMAADDGRPADRLELLAESERRLVVQEWNHTEAVYPAEPCIHELFEAQAERTPGAAAVAFGEAALSYAELNRGANRLAHHLRGLGVGPDARVGICVERGLEMIVSVLAVLKAGGAYVPLDPEYPRERLRDMLQDSEPVVLLTQGSLRGQLDGVLGETDVPVLELDAAAPEWASRPEANLRPGGVGPGHPAYVIYTSGSTGRPKGVAVPHANVARLFAATRPWFGFGERDVWTLFHSFAFDFSVWEIWGALLHGGRLVVVDRETARSPEDFHRLLCREGVTVLNQTPSAFRALIGADAAREEPNALREVIFGGEALETAMLKPWFARHGDRRPRLVNMYGITETTVHVTFHPLEAADAERSGPSPIGRRIPDLRVYVLDRWGEPMPLGVAGELYVGGPGVARGYLHRPAQTAERFVPDPFDAVPGARLYRTGDLARWLADGTLAYLGRNDQQVKIRGFRIEPGEVEARLAEHPGVRGAVVLAREDTPGDRRLVAYYVAREQPVAADLLRAHLAERLAEHMVPAAYVPLDALPLTPNGKLDRAALPAPEGDAYARRGYEAPIGETEAALTEIWAEVLGVDRVGRRDNFFELGGHSLLVVHLVERMRQRGLHAPVRALFVAPTLAELAREVGAEAWSVKVPDNLIPVPDAMRDAGIEEMEFIV